MRFAFVAAVVLSASILQAESLPVNKAASATKPLLAERDVNVPVDIRGNRVEYQGKSGKVIFTGNVVVIRGSSRLTADELTTLKGAGEAVARGRVTVKDAEKKIDLTCEEAGYRNGLRYVRASGTCHLIAGEGDNLTVVNSKEMELYVDTRDAVARGDVRINQAENEAECQEARLTEYGEKLTLTGSPVLRRPPHEFRADEVISYVRDGKLVMTGNVKAILHTGKLDDL